MMDLSGEYEPNEAGTHCKRCGWANIYHSNAPACADAHRLALSVRGEPPDEISSIGWKPYQEPIERALATQVGGGHYKDMAIQPVEYIHKNGIGYFEGCVIKYVSRWKKKNGIEDLRKARHFIDLLIELETKV